MARVESPGILLSVKSIRTGIIYLDQSFPGNNNYSIVHFRVNILLCISGFYFLFA
jgi:hypothetical protein